jgi:hypothetical protein
MLRSRISPLLLFVLLALAISGGMAVAAEPDKHTFVVAASEGYGVQDCLAERGECGQVVADAWCEAHGHGVALSFGSAEDVTSVMTNISASKLAPGSYVITCGD